jgi:hypothetical protein
MVKMTDQGVLRVEKKSASPDGIINMQKESWLTACGGRIICLRCQATSKRTGRQCGAPAVVGKRVCRFHGGRSTGPRTPEGRQRCAAAKTVHGQQTRAARAEMALDARRLRAVEALGFLLGILPGLKTRGRKPQPLPGP